jgi:predicted neutral ceramidase superfamily lipid hydrolase
MGKGFDSSWITPTFRGALLVRLVIEGAIVIIVPFVRSFLVNLFSLLAPIFYPTTCISTMDDIAQIVVILIMPLTMLLWWSEATSRVLPGTLPAVKLVTPGSIFVIVDRVHNGC